MVLVWEVREREESGYVMESSQERGHVMELCI